MLNKGLTNHIKFRTKFWQERQSRSRQCFQETILADEKLALEESRSPCSIGREPNKKGNNLKLGQSIIRKNNKISLKMELLELNSDRFNTIRHQVRTANVANTNQRQGYRKMSYRQRVSRNQRPSTSLTIEVSTSSQRSYAIQQQFSVFETRGRSLFMPVHSSRYRGGKGGTHF